MYGARRVTCGGFSLLRDLVTRVEGETLSSYSGCQRKLVVGTLSGENWKILR